MWKFRIVCSGGECRHSGARDVVVTEFSDGKQLRRGLEPVIGKLV